MNTVQVIKRHPGPTPLPAQKQVIDGEVSQVSFNSDGRLIVRFVGFAAGQDTLLVFDEATSARIIGFCQNTLAGRRPTPAAKTAADDDVPF